MTKYVLQGFILGLAYLAPIGMQNLYVINTAISMNKIRAYQVAIITIFFDISLALACFYGVGVLMDSNKALKLLILLIGSIAVIYIGISLIRSKPDLLKEVNINKSILQIISACFVVTWLNPQAIIDGSLLLGGIKASLPINASKFFIQGVCLASITWFLGLAIFVSSFRNMFNIKVLRKINIICGGVVIYYGLKLGYSFFELIK